MKLMMSSQTTVSATTTATLKSSLHKTAGVLKLQYVQRWSEMQKMIPKGQHLAKQNLVHVVKEGENLSCISKMYKVSIYEIAAANKDILDLNLVFHGQQLQIPSYLTPYKQTARNTVCVIVLVPLIAFCIISALYNRVSGALRSEEKHTKHRTSKSIRWKVALSDLNPDIIMDDAQSTPNYDEVEDKEVESEDNSNCNKSYNEQLERDYQNFLSECGMG